MVNILISLNSSINLQCHFMTSHTHSSSIMYIANSLAYIFCISRSYCSYWLINNLALEPSCGGILKIALVWVGLIASKFCSLILCYLCWLPVAVTDFQVLLTYFVLLMLTSGCSECQQPTVNEWRCLDERFTLSGGFPTHGHLLEICAF